MWGVERRTHTTALSASNRPWEGCILFLSMQNAIDLRPSRRRRGNRLLNIVSAHKLRTNKGITWKASGT